MKYLTLLIQSITFKTLQFIMHAYTHAPEENLLFPILYWSNQFHSKLDFQAKRGDLYLLCAIQTQFLVFREVKFQRPKISQVTFSFLR